jgi:Flp pilus assembly protein TadG
MAHAWKTIRFRHLLARGARSLGNFPGDQAGGTVILTALAFSVLLGFAGLGVDGILWYANKRHNQTVADNAAVAGTIALTRDGNISLADLKQVVWDSAAKNGFVHGTNGTVTVNRPPAFGPNAGNNSFVEVIVEETATLHFSHWMRGGESFNVQARAVGNLISFGEHCIVALDPEADKAILVSGTADITSDCGLASNSNSDQAIMIQGTADLSAQPLQAYGDIDAKGAGSWDSDYPPQPLSERIEDPYADLMTGLQADVSCVGATQQHFSEKDSPLSPGHYCGGIQITGNVTFLPGTYYIDNGDFRIIASDSTETVTGDGVTFILTAMHADDLGTVDLSGGANVVLEAPRDESEGEYPGMLFIQDPYVPGVADATSLPKNMFTGGTGMTLAGRIYFPNMDVVFGGGSFGTVGCTMIIARTVTFEGNTHLDNDATACEEAGITSGITQTRVRLVE